MFHVASYLLFSIYTGFVGGVIYINSITRNREELFEQDIEPIPSRFQNRERMTVGERFV